MNSGPMTAARAAEGRTVAPPQHGTQDVTEQRRTYHAFLIALRYIVLAHIVVGVFFISTLAGGASWLQGLIAALICLALGLYFAKDRRRVGPASKIATLVTSTAADSGHTDEAGEMGHILSDTAETLTGAERRPTEV